MASPIPDRYLWFGLGVFVVAAAYAVRYAITDIVELTVLPKDWNNDKKRDTCKQPEDGMSHYHDRDPLPQKLDFNIVQDLDLDTLKTLSQSSNPHIANSAISLIIERFAALPDVRQEMAEDFNSPDPETRHRARTITKFLQEYPLPPGLERVVMPAMLGEEQLRPPPFIPRQAEWFQRNLARNGGELRMLNNEVDGVEHMMDAGEHT